MKASPDSRYLVFKISKNPEGNQNTIVPNYITASGYVEDIPGRTKVGNQLATYQSYVYDRSRDSIYAISIKDIPGIKDLPDYVKDYPKQLEELDESSCKWPIGHPDEKSFYFCGRSSLKDFSYCKLQTLYLRFRTQQKVIAQI